MSREVRRVPVDFDWPLSKVWHGYLLPERLRETPCVTCDSRGVTSARLWVAHLATLLLMLDEDRRAQDLDRPLHPYLVAADYGYNRPRPSADIVEFGAGLGGRSSDGWFGHDAIDRWHATDAVIAAAGLDPEVWGRCIACDAHGSIEAYVGQRADADAWEPTEPPTGEAWQLWETVSEGSPISPVFAERDGLVHWLTTPAYTFGTSTPLTAEQAERFVDAAWAPSMVFTPANGLTAGDAWVGSGR